MYFSLKSLFPDLNLCFNKQTHDYLFSLGMSDVYSTAIRQSGESKMNQCQWFNLVTVCKDTLFYLYLHFVYRARVLIALY